MRHQSRPASRITPGPSFDVHASAFSVSTAGFNHKVSPEDATYHYSEDRRQNGGPGERHTRRHHTPWLSQAQEATAGHTETLQPLLHATVVYEQGHEEHHEQGRKTTKRDHSVGAQREVKQGKKEPVAEEDGRLQGHQRATECLGHSILDIFVCKEEEGLSEPRITVI